MAAASRQPAGAALLTGTGRVTLDRIGGGAGPGWGAYAMSDTVARQTGQDQGVRDYVLNTPGANRIINDAVHELTALHATANGRPVQLLVNCWYGRHRAPAIAIAIGQRMQTAGARVAVTHHHINRPPVPRKHPRPDCPFCAIAHQGAPATIIRAWRDTLAILPRGGGCTNGHILVIPTAHVTDFTIDPVVSGTTQMRAAELAQELADQSSGQWNYLTSCGPDATQTVFHLHGHLLPRRADDGLTLPWTPRGNGSLLRRRPELT